MKIVTEFRKLFIFRKFHKGYVFILTLVMLPFILLGTKYIIDEQSINNIKLLKSRIFGNEEKTENNYYKICAKEAALAVARKWNPALTYKQQKGSMLRIADEVYNKSPTSYDSILISEAIPGVNVAIETKVNKGKGYDLTKIEKKEVIELTPDQKQIEYETNATPLLRYYYEDKDGQAERFIWNGLRNMHLTYINNDKSLFTTIETDHANEEDINKESRLFKDFCVSVNQTGSSQLPYAQRWYLTVPQKVGVATSTRSTNTGESMVYTERKYKDDDTVKIECENDRIKVTTDNDVGYAVPAECNVDIVLAIPVNSAASNKNNLDLNTTTSEEVDYFYDEMPQNEEKSTPIYQISKAYQTFLKYFFYTRGVNVGIIPYSGNISITKEGVFIDRSSSWIKNPDRFVADYFTNYNNWNVYNYENKYLSPNILGAALYGTSGQSVELTNEPFYDSSDKLYGLLCRGNTVKEQGNTLTKGDLLSIDDPINYKFRKQIINPCYITDVNLLSMKCEGSQNVYYPNPHYLIELNSDLLYIYYMLSAFYPYYHDHNQSNFIFIPVTWCNNLFQIWTSTGENVSVDTEKDSVNLGRLSTPSKMEQGRKKVLILTINKPDWFEPSELTYIGFDNDYSDTPAVESDTIRFDINYSDSSKKYENGKNYDGTIQGQKGILKYTSSDTNYVDGYYECESGSGRLTYPEKYLVKLVVAPKGTIGKITFTNITADSSIIDTGENIVEKEKEFYIVPTQMNDCYIDFNMEHIKLISAEITNRPHSIVNGKPDFGKGLKNPERSVYIDMLKMASDGKFNYNYCGNDTTAPDGKMIYGSNVAGDIGDTGIKCNQKDTESTVLEHTSLYEDPTEWKNTNLLPETGTKPDWSIVCYGNDKFVTFARNSSIAAYSEDGINWTRYNLPVFANWRDICFGNNMFVAVGDEYVLYSSDGIKWTALDLSEMCWGYSNYWTCVYFGDNKFVVVSEEGDIIYSEDGINWIVKSKIHFRLKRICYGKDMFVATVYYGPGKSRSILYSRDGINWYEPVMPFKLNAYAICYGNNKFVVTAGEYYGDYSGAYSEDGINWIPIDSITEGNWFSVCYAAGKFVAVEYDGLIAVSENGISWNINKLSLSYLDSRFYLENICYGNNKYVITGCSMNFSMYSEDGIDWKRSNKLPYLSNWSSICCGGGRFVAVASDSDIAAYSDDGINWNEAHMPDINLWSSVCYGNGRFLATAGEYRRAYMQEAAYSDNGIDWIEVKLPSGNYLGAVNFVNGNFVILDSWHSTGIISKDGISWTRIESLSLRDWSMVCYGNGKYVAVSFDSSLVAYSEDCINWTEYSMEMYCQFICYGGGKFLAIPGIKKYCYLTNELMYSEDGIHWNKAYMPKMAAWSSICYGEDKFVAVSYGGKYGAYSFDGIHWALFELPSDRYWTSICYDSNLSRFVAVNYDGECGVYCDIEIKNGNFVAVAMDSKVSAYSSEAKSWVGSSLPSSTSWQSVCFGKGKFVAVVYGNNISAYSEDGVNWTQTTLPCVASWQSICFGNGKFVVVAESSDIAAYSKNGVNWTQTTLPSTRTWKRICNGGGKFIAISQSDIAAYSVDGISWIQIVLPVSQSWKSVCFGGGKFVVVGNSDIAAYSEDGISWFQTTLPQSKNWKALSYGKGRFVTFAYNTNMGVYSEDGKTWVQVRLPTSSSWQSLCYGNSKFVALVEEGNILIYSEDGINWKQTRLPISQHWKSICYGKCIEEEEEKEEPEGWYCYNNNGNDSINHHLIPLSYLGDMYLTTNSGKYLFDVGITYFDFYQTSTDSTLSKYLGAGMYRIALPFKNMFWDSIKNIYDYKWDLKSLSDVPLQMLYAGMTLPINIMLYYGAGSSSDHIYSWQSNSLGEISELDTNEALKKVTQDACSKLKNDWGSNLRIYLIKFRKQNKYRSKINKEEKSFDYSYLNSCASGTRAPYVYDISTEKDLRESLSRISEDIKSWTGAQDARNE